MGETEESGKGMSITQEELNRYWQAVAFKEDVPLGTMIDALLPTKVTDTELEQEMMLTAVLPGITRFNEGESIRCVRTRESPDAEWGPWERVKAIITLASPKPVQTSDN
jgi:hypothetical protein